MTSENTQPTSTTTTTTTTTTTEDVAIPAHLVDSVRALGAAVAAHGLPDPKNSPEDLARLVDRLQKTFGAAAAAGKSGQVAPPPSPFVGEYGAEVKKQDKDKDKGRYHVQVEEVEDEHWAKRT